MSSWGVSPGVPLYQTVSRLAWAWQQCAQCKHCTLLALPARRSLPASAIALSKWLSYKHYTLLAELAGAHLTYSQFLNPPTHHTTCLLLLLHVVFHRQQHWHSSNSNSNNMASYFCAIFAAIYAHSRAARTSAPTPPKMGTAHEASRLQGRTAEGHSI